MSEGEVKNGNPLTTVDPSTLVFDDTTSRGELYKLALSVGYAGDWGSSTKPILSAYLKERKGSNATNSSSSSSTSQSATPADSAQSGASAAAPAPMSIASIVAAAAAKAAAMAACSAVPVAAPVTTPTADTTSAESKAQVRKRKRASRWGGRAKIESKDTMSTALVVAPERKKKTRWGSKKVMNPQALILAKQQTELANAMEAIKKQALALDKETEDDRAPSPEPIYDQNGMRINTREQRKSKKLQDTTHLLIQQAMKMNPIFAGLDKQFRTRYQVKIYLPQDKFPGVNFKGILIGVRGRNQKRLEAETGCQIAVRGKDMRKRKDGLPSPDDYDENHVLVIASSQEQLDAAENKIRSLLVPPPPDHQEKMMVELAIANGTYMDRSQIRCHICGEMGHKISSCPNRAASTWAAANVLCERCGDTSHLTIDCPHAKSLNPHAAKQKLDSEYNDFMAELTGEGPPAASSAPAPGGHGGGHSGGHGPPYRPPKPGLGASKPPWGGHGGGGSRFGTPNGHGFPPPPSGAVGGHGGGHGNFGGHGSFGGHGRFGGGGGHGNFPPPGRGGHGNFPPPPFFGGRPPWQPPRQNSFGGPFPFPPRPPHNPGAWSRVMGGKPNMPNMPNMPPPPWGSGPPPGMPPPPWQQPNNSNQTTDTATKSGNPNQNSGAPPPPPPATPPPPSNLAAPTPPPGLNPYGGGSNPYMNPSPSNPYMPPQGYSGGNPYM